MIVMSCPGEAELTILPQITVSTNPLADSMSTANFKDPFTFRPERWLEESSLDDLEVSQPLHGTKVNPVSLLMW
jgi:cytochrome P450